MFKVAIDCCLSNTDNNNINIKASLYAYIQQQQQDRQQKLEEKINKHNS
jgi:hypothetical protein